MIVKFGCEPSCDERGRFWDQRVPGARRAVVLSSYGVGRRWRVREQMIGEGGGNST